MAFQTKYTVSWADVEGVSWEVWFQTDPWAGAVTALTPGASPLKITWNGSDKYQPVVGSNADIQMVYESAIDTLYTEEAHVTKVIIRGNGGTIWTGFVSPGQYFRNFNQPKHYVTITATDGLGELKNIKFEDGSGDPYWGQETEIVTIANILQKTDFDTTIVEAVNIFDDNHSTGAAESALAQTYIYQERYWDEQTDERSDCYTVLEEILTKYGAIIRQSNNAWLILRPNSYSAATIYYRSFTYLGVYSANSSFQSYAPIDSDLFYIHADQELTKMAGVGTCEVTQSPPRRENMFKNGSFDAFTWTAGAADYWTATGLPGYSADAGALKMDGCATTAIPTKYIECTTDVYYTDSVEISLDWTPHYVGSPSYKNLYLQIYDATAAQYLTTAGAWQAGVTYYVVAAGTSDTEDRVNISLPNTRSQGYYRASSIRFRIYEFHNEGVSGANYLHLDNLRMEVDMSLPDNKIHTYANPITINQIASSDMPSGDSWRGDFFAGGFDDGYYITTYNSGANLTTLWSITGDPTASAPIGEVLARQTVEGYRRSVDVIRGSLRGAYTTLSYVGIEDSDFTDEYGYSKRYFPLGITLDGKLNEWSGEWLECPSTYTDESIEWASSDYSTYTITADEIEVDSSPGDGTATSDPYTVVAGETIRIILELTNDGSSNLPWFEVDGVNHSVHWGTNLITQYFAAAGAKTIILGDDVPGENHNYTATLTVYSLTGV